MNNADQAIVFYSPEAVKLKNLEEIDHKFISDSFNHKNMKIFNNSDELTAHLFEVKKTHTNILLMSSGNFGGINLFEIAKKLLKE